MVVGSSIVTSFSIVEESLQVSLPYLGVAYLSSWLLFWDFVLYWVAYAVSIGISGIVFFYDDSRALWWWKVIFALL